MIILVKRKIKLQAKNRELKINWVVKYFVKKQKFVFNTQSPFMYFLPVFHLLGYDVSSSLAMSWWGKDHCPLILPLHMPFNLSRDLVRPSYTKEFVTLTLQFADMSQKTVFLQIEDSSLLPLLFHLLTSHQLLDCVWK